MNIDKQDSINFVWGNVGKKLEKLSEKRLFSIAQKNPEYYLYMVYSDELDNMFDDIIENGIEGYEEKIIELNEKHNLFIEISEFLTESNEIVSIGSTLTGQIDKSDRFAKILKTED